MEDEGVIYNNGPLTLSSQGGEGRLVLGDRSFNVSGSTRSKDGQIQGLNAGLDITLPIAERLQLLYNLSQYDNTVGLQGELSPSVGNIGARITTPNDPRYAPQYAVNYFHPSGLQMGYTGSGDYQGVNLAYGRRF